MESISLGQVPDACTLPTAERPLRVAELDRLFADTVTGLDRVSPEQLRLTLTPTAEVAAETASLIVRESACCSFFTFSLTATAGALHLDVTVPPSQTTVLDGLIASAGPAGHQ